MDYSYLKKIVDSFSTELKRASEGSSSSLSFIKSTTPSEPLIHEGDIFQVMTIGGTNFRSALVAKQRDGLVLSELIAEEVPSLATKEIFLSFLKEHLHDGVSVVALNVGFPLKPFFENGKIDGVLFSNPKEHALAGVIGKKIGEEFEKYIHEEHSRKIKVSVANDTICLLLSGLTNLSYDHLAGGVIGTGVNFALFQDKNTPVNLEGGNFDKFTLSEDTAEVDRHSIHPGEQFYEKEIAGGYLYKRFNVQIQKENISYPPLKSGSQLSVLAKERHDRLGDIARGLLEHSAQFAACAIAGIMEFQKKDLTFVMQGSVFWKGNNYREMVEKVLPMITHYKAHFIAVENADIIGAARLVV